MTLPVSSKWPRKHFEDTYREIVDPRDMEDYVTTALTSDYFLPHVDDPSSSLLLAIAGARLVGYALVTRSAPPSCVNRYSPVELARIYLRREVIGKGYGAALMRVSQAEARRLRADGILARCLRSKPSRARVLPKVGLHRRRHPAIHVG
jgi:GNAT superfamily N-acetyltransferase